MSAINLLPGTPLDGGALVSAVVWRLRNDRITGRIAAASGGILIATSWSISPFLLNYFLGWELDPYNIVVSFLVGMWLASAAWNSLWSARKARNEPAELGNTTPATDVASTENKLVDGADVLISIMGITRRAIAVDENENIESSLREAEARKAGAIIVVRGEQVIGIVRDAAVSAVPMDRRNITKVNSTARRISELDRLPLSLSLQALREALVHLGESEWLVVDEENKIVGVVLRHDLEAHMKESRS
jgi:CBS domain-containing protein